MKLLFNHVSWSDHGQTLISQISLTMFHGQVMVKLWSVANFKNLLNHNGLHENNRYFILISGILYCPYHLKLVTSVHCQTV